MRPSHFLEGDRFFDILYILYIFLQSCRITFDPMIFFSIPLAKAHPPSELAE